MFLHEIEVRKSPVDINVLRTFDCRMTYFRTHGKKNRFTNRYCYFLPGDHQINFLKSSVCVSFLSHGPLPVQCGAQVRSASGWVKTFCKQNCRMLSLAQPDPFIGQYRVTSWHKCKHDACAHWQANDVITWLKQMTSQIFYSVTSHICAVARRHSVKVAEFFLDARAYWQAKCRAKRKHWQGVYRSFAHRCPPFFIQFCSINQQT